MGTKLVKSKRYPNLWRDESSGTYIYRKYSAVKGKEFNRATGEKEKEAEAYKKGLDAFNEWLGNVTDQTGKIFFARYAKRYLNAKMENPKLSEKTKKNFRSQLEATPGQKGRPRERERPRLIEAFGHLQLHQINNEVWMKWIGEILASEGEFKFFNARKVLLEILHDAHDCTYIERVPKLELPDAEAAPPRELTREEIRRLFRACHYVVQVRGRGRSAVPMPRPDGKGFVRQKNWIKLLIFIMWKQGARPGEILQYEWTMIKLEEGSHGRIHIPGRITKTRRARVISLNPSVARILRFLRPRTEPLSPHLFPSPTDPARPIQSYAKAWQGVCQRAGIEAQMYWLRDTFVTRKLHEGLSTIFLAKYLDSSAKMLEQKYAVASDKAMEDVAK